MHQGKNNREAYTKILKKRIGEVEEKIYRFLPTEEGYQRTVLAAMNYTMQAGGKRIRHMMM